MTLRDRQVKDETGDDQGEGQKGDIKADNEQKSEHFTPETTEKQNNHSEQTRNFKDGQKKEMAKESVKPRDKQKGGKSQKRSKRSKERRKKVKTADRKKEQVAEWTTGFDPNLMCNRRQARNFCFGSGFAGHDVSACKTAI